MVASVCYWMKDDQAADDADLIERTTARLIDEYMPIELPRGHLGMSQIGKKDERTLWLQFRWSLPDVPTPRTRRIFRVGHALESEIISLLKNIPGVEVHDRNPSTGGQFNFKFIGGHFAGSMDGCIQGIPESKQWHVLEIKTVSAKRFADLQKQGVETWSPEYFAQLQCYMGATGMERALFMAYCKDNSELHIERVKFIPMAFDTLLAKAERLINSSEPPASSYPKREWFEAKFMSEAAQKVYWGDTLPAPNCRNCRFASPRLDTPNAEWWCGLLAQNITIGSQRVGCDRHNYLLALMPAELQELGDITTRYKAQDGTGFINAFDTDRRPSVYSSKELYAISQHGLNAATLADEQIQALSESFDATVIGMEAA